MIRLLSETTAAESVDGDDALQTSAVQDTAPEAPNPSVQEVGQASTVSASVEEVYDEKRASVNTVDSCDVTAIAEEASCNEGDQPQSSDADTSAMQTVRHNDKQSSAIFVSLAPGLYLNVRA